MVMEYTGKTGTIRWAIETKGNALAFLAKKEMNDIVRRSMLLAGKDWMATFLPKRFSHYVERRPFPYPSHRLGFFYGKARRMGIVKDILARLSVTKGWDPWSTNRPDLQLIQEWKKLNPGKYNFRDRVFSSGLIGDMRRNAKRAVMEVIDEMWGDGKFVPLIESGLLKGSVLQGAKCTATATGNKQILRITMPMPLRPGQQSGKGGTNGTVSAVLQTVPHWEVKWFSRKLAGYLGQILSNRHGLSQDARGMVTQRAKTDFQATQNQRAFAQAVPR